MRGAASDLRSSPSMDVQDLVYGSRPRCRYSVDSTPASGLTRGQNCANTVLNFLFEARVETRLQ